MTSKLNEIIRYQAVSLPADLQFVGFDITAGTVEHSGGTQTVFAVTSITIPGIHTVLRLVRADDLPMRLVAGYGLAVAPVALPEDLTQQEAANAATEDVLTWFLVNHPEVAKSLVESMRLDWALIRARLVSRWEEIAKRGQGANTLAVLKAGTNLHIGLACGTTLLGLDELFAVNRVKKFYKLNRYVKQTLPLDHKNLAQIENLSGSEKLSLLRPNGGSEYEIARAEFDRQRLMRRAVPITLPDAVAWGGAYLDTSVQYNVQYSSGNTGRVFISLKAPENRLSISARLTSSKLKSDISISLDREGTSRIERARTHEKRFGSVEILDEMVRQIFSMIIALDLDFPEHLLPQIEKEFDIAHPLLAGLDIPKAQQPILAQFLGDAYTAACRGAERLSALRARKSAKNQAAVESSAGLADGAILAVIDPPNPEFLLPFATTKSRLGQARSADSASGRRRREIYPLFGFANTRPLTPKHVAKLPPVLNPNFLSDIHDLYLRLEERDLVEAAFRLSFSLTDGGRNPLLEGSTGIEYLKTPVTLPDLRITRMLGDSENRALAITVAQKTLSPLEQLAETSTGASFLVMVAGDMISFHVRPALIGLDVTAPANHRQAIQFGINVIAEDTAEAAAWSSAFGDKWKDYSHF